MHLLTGGAIGRCLTDPTPASSGTWVSARSGGEKQSHFHGKLARCWGETAQLRRCEGLLRLAVEGLDRAK
jgi:hypothetical protein